MRIGFLSVLAITFAFGSVSGASAAGYCPNQPNGKCPTKSSASPSKKGIPQEQRAEFMKKARLVCKQKYGAEATVQRIDYAKPLIWCTNNTR